MTIKELSTRLKVSPQAIYKRVKAAGVALDGLKDKQTGELTQEGEALIRGLFEPLNQVENKDKELIAQLKAKVETLEQEVEYLRKALDQAQQLQAMALQRLALPAPRRGWWSKLFGRGAE